MSDCFGKRRRIWKENSSKLLRVEPSRLWLSLSDEDENEKIMMKTFSRKLNILLSPRHYTIIRSEFYQRNSNGFRSSKLIGFSIKIFQILQISSSSHFLHSTLLHSQPNSSRFFYGLKLSQARFPRFLFFIYSVISNKKIFSFK